MAVSEVDGTAPSLDTTISEFCFRRHKAHRYMLWGKSKEQIKRAISPCRSNTLQLTVVA